MDPLRPDVADLPILPQLRWGHRATDANRGDAHPPDGRRATDGRPGRVRLAGAGSAAGHGFATKLGLLLLTDRRNVYAPVNRNLTTESAELEAWLLACILSAEPDRSIPYADLIHLPLLSPFQISITAGQLHRMDGFNIQRQGVDLDMVRYAH